MQMTQAGMEYTPMRVTAATMSLILFTNFPKSAHGNTLENAFAIESSKN